MAQYTQIDAYKHLLQVSQNIIYSSQIDDQIIKKYQELKRSILNKIVKEKESSFNVAVMAIYRTIVDNSIKIIDSFEYELENKMERKNYNEQIINLNQSVIGDIQALEEKLNQKPASSGLNKANKLKLLQKQQLSALKYKFDQIDTKFQNLGLLIQVHKKMHQIILQATKSQQKRQNIDQNYKQQIRMLEQKTSHIIDVNEYLNQYKMTQDSFKKYKMSSKLLKEILFDFGNNQGRKD